MFHRKTRDKSGCPPSRARHRRPIFHCRTDSTFFSFYSSGWFFFFLWSFPLIFILFFFFFFFFLWFGGLLSCRFVSIHRSRCQCQLSAASVHILRWEHSRNVRPMNSTEIRIFIYFKRKKNMYTSLKRKNNLSEIEFLSQEDWTVV